MATKAATKTRAPTVGALIDQIWAAREEKRRLESQVKEVETTIAALQEQIMERLEAEGLDKASGSKATVSISANTVANVEDWDSFWSYIIKNKYTHLLQRRVSDPAYRELLEQGKRVPGVQPFVKRTLNVRSI